MKVVIQRVSRASILINQTENKEIQQGLVVLVGIVENDTDEDIEWLSGKISRLRIFDDENGVMNKSIKDINGEILLVSQFTLHASTKKGNRPSYIHAANPNMAIPIYEKFIMQLERDLEKKITTGTFGAHMSITLTNEGPVTIIIDSKNKE